MNIEKKNTFEKTVKANKMKHKYFIPQQNSHTLNKTQSLKKEHKDKKRQYSTIQYHNNRCNSATHPSVFYQVSNHDDAVGLLLPRQAPDIVECELAGSLHGDPRVGLTVCLLERI